VAQTHAIYGFERRRWLQMYAISGATRDCTGLRTDGYRGGIDGLSATQILRSTAAGSHLGRCSVGEELVRAELVLLLHGSAEYLLHTGGNHTHSRHNHAQSIISHGQIAHGPVNGNARVQEPSRGFSNKSSISCTLSVPPSV